MITTINDLLAMRATRRRRRLIQNSNSSRSFNRWSGSSERQYTPLGLEPVMWDHRASSTRRNPLRSTALLSRPGNTPAVRGRRLSVRRTRRYRLGIADNARGAVREVGAKAPSEWGFHDMLGSDAPRCPRAAD
jgi:hypothetical protein